MVFGVGGVGVVFVVVVAFEVGGAGVAFEVGGAAFASGSGSTSGMAGSIWLSAIVADVTGIGPSITSKSAESSSTLGS